MNIIYPSSQICTQLSSLLKQLTDEQYEHTLEVFSGASIGQHTRHIIEFYQCLLAQKDKNYVCYDERKRDIRLETSVEFSVDVLTSIANEINMLKEDKTLTLKGELAGEMNEFPSSLSRELLYALEHAVHHMAIIKIGILLNVPSVKIPTDFGVAESTIRYRKDQCAQ